MQHLPRAPQRVPMQQPQFQHQMAAPGMQAYGPGMHPVPMQGYVRGHPGLQHGGYDPQAMAQPGMHMGVGQQEVYSYGVPAELGHQQMPMQSAQGIWNASGPQHPQHLYQHPPTPYQPGRRPQEQYRTYN